MYEGVTYGTPVTPVFETKEELINYLVNVGDHYGRGSKVSRSSAEAFVEIGWVPSGALSDGSILLSYEIASAGLLK